MVFSYLVWPKPRWLMWQQTWLREAACWVDGLLHSIIRWVCVRVIDSPSRYAFSTHACVFFKVLLLFRITWLVRKCLPVCVFVFFLFPVGRFPSCTEKTDLSIYNIQISSRREKKNAAAEKLKKKYLFDLELGVQLCMHTADNIFFTDWYSYRAANMSQRHLGGMIHVFCSRYESVLWSPCKSWLLLSEWSFPTAIKKCHHISPLLFPSSLCLCAWKENTFGFSCNCPASNCCCSILWSLPFWI